MSVELTLLLVTLIPTFYWPRFLDLTQIIDAFLLSVNTNVLNQLALQFFGNKNLTGKDSDRFVQVA